MNHKQKWFCGLFLFLAGLALVAMAQTQPPAAAAIGPKYLSWVNDEVNYIITAKEKEVFLKLQTDRERDIMIEAFWKQRDPSPGTPENEFKIEHYRRLQYADQMFGTPTTPGRKTEAGRLYIILGTGKVADQSTQAAPSWIKMRIFEVPGKGAGEPAKAVTSSYLNYSLTATIKTEFDLAEEMKQIQKTFNYQDVRLLTEADFMWKRGDRDKAFHIFRLDGREYLVLITPVEVLRKLTFRIEVFEQGEKAKVNLLDTEFSIPERNITVFGFEDTKGNVYFLSFRVTGWTPSAGYAGGSDAAAYVIPAEGPVRAIGEIKPPRLLKQVNLRYPEIARQARVEGLVILEAETDISGHVQNVKILRSIPLLDQAAVDCVRQWVYEPLMIDGKPRGVIFTVTVRFQLDGGAGKTSPPTKDGAPLKLSGDVKGPKLITQVDPVYPPVARQSRVEGTVILEVTTDIYGRVRDIKVLRSIPLLDQAAVDAVRQWVFEPPIINGKPISLTFTTTVQFVLDGGKPRPMGGVMGGVIGGKEGETGAVGITIATEPYSSGGVTGGVPGFPLSWIREDAKTPSKDESAPVKAAGDIKPPKLVKQVVPVYPELARQARIDGTVVLEVETDVAGKVRRVKAVGSDVMQNTKPDTAQQAAQVLFQVAIEAIRQWEYEPLIVDGKPRAALFTVMVNFRLR